MRALAAVRCFLSLGSNLGDRLFNLKQAVDRLASTDGIEVLRSSRIYETTPVGPPQPDYLNAVLEIATSLPPRELLSQCHRIEDELGRIRRERWGPRPIDIDILTFGDEELEEPELAIPHPRMHERAFVLAPLAELDIDPVLPGGRRLGSLRLGGAAFGDVRPYAPALRPG